MGERERERQRHKRDLPLTGLLLKCLQQLWLDQEEAKSLEVNLGPHMGSRDSEVESSSVAS